jgi:hypothetical protein
VNGAIKLEKGFWNSFPQNLLPKFEKITRLIWTFCGGKKSQAKSNFSRFEMGGRSGFHLSFNECD